MWEKVWQYLATSSADPSKVAMSAKGAMMAAVPTLLFLIHLKGLSTSQDQLVQAIDAVVQGITAVLTAISSFMVVVGLGRKALVGLGLYTPKS